MIFDREYILQSLKHELLLVILVVVETIMKNLCLRLQKHLLAIMKYLDSLCYINFSVLILSLLSKFLLFFFDQKKTNHYIRLH